MRTTEFTEFSYGYALVDSFIRGHIPTLKKAPVFPSLIREGKPGGGYDVKLPNKPHPIFLQFKIPQLVSRNSKLMPPGYSSLTKPYYRMHLRTKAPNQHQLLIDLQTTEPYVFYASPLFTRLDELDRNFVAGRTHINSIFFRPRSIGALDSNPHHVAYHPGASACWRRSEPVQIEERINGENLFAYLEKDASSRAGRHSEEVVTELRQWLISRANNLRARARRARSADAGMTVGSDIFTELEKSSNRPFGDQARTLAYAFQVHLGVTLGFFESPQQD